MTAILKKEIKVYFSSMTGYVFIMVFLAFSGAFFTAYTLNIQSSDLTEVFYRMLGVLMYIVPLLTMKLFSEEKKLKTFVGLKTLPLSIWQIIAGKFLAAMTVMAIASAFTFSYVVVVLAAGRVAWSLVLGNYLAMMLLCSALISIGMLVSAFTENQIIAAVVTFGIFYVSGFLGELTTTVSSPYLVAILDTLAVFNHHSVFAAGVFSVSSAVYYLSVTVLMMAFMSLALRTKRWD